MAHKKVPEGKNKIPPVNCSQCSKRWNMFYRSVYGLGTLAPQEKEIYVERGKQRAEEGDANFNPFGK